MFDRRSAILLVAVAQLGLIAVGLARTIENRAANPALAGAGAGRYRAPKEPAGDLGRGCALSAAGAT